LRFFISFYSFNKNYYKKSNGLIRRGINLIENRDNSIVRY